MDDTHASGISEDQVGQMLSSVTALHEQIQNALVPAMNVMQSLSNDFRGFKLPQFEFPAFDVSGLNKLADVYPRNFEGGLKKIEKIAALAGTGTPVTWVLPPELLDELLEADGEDHERILVSSQHDVLDYCLDSLVRCSGVWGDEARETIEAHRSGFRSAAQSHAAGLADTIILDLYANPKQPKADYLARAGARDAAKVKVDRSQQFVLAVEYITIKPATKIFDTWRRGQAGPKNFSRHATAHCVGDPNAFTPFFALQAVMFAASLVCHFGDEPGGVAITREGGVT